MLLVLKYKFSCNPTSITSLGLSSPSFRTLVPILLSTDPPDGLVGYRHRHTPHIYATGGRENWMEQRSEAGNGKKEEEVKKTREDEEEAG